MDLETVSQKVKTAIVLALVAIALAIVGWALAGTTISFFSNSLFITTASQLDLNEGANVTISATSSGSRVTYTISSIGVSGSSVVNAQENGVGTVTGASAFDFLDPFDVFDASGIARVSFDPSELPIATWGNTVPFSWTLQSNEDVTLTLRADLDNTIETDNPSIHFIQNGGAVEALVALDSNNDLLLDHLFNNENIHLKTSGTGSIDLELGSGSGAELLVRNPTNQYTFDGSEADWFGNFLRNVGFLESNSSNPATAGTVRLGNTESIAWRNSTSLDNLTLGVSSSDVFEFVGGSVAINNTTNCSSISTDSNGVLACGAAGGTQDLQETYNQETAPALITLTDTLGGLQINGDAETAEPSLSVLDDVEGQIGILLDNNDPTVSGNAPTVEGVTGDTANGTNPLVLALPTPVSAGDLIIVAVDTDSTAGITWPAGWVELAEVVETVDIDPDARVAIAYLDASGGETSVSISGLDHSAATAYRITGHADPSVHPPEVNISARGSTNVCDPTNFSPSNGAENYLWIAGCGRGVTHLATDPPTNYTNLRTLASSLQGASLHTAQRSLLASTENPGSFTGLFNNDNTVEFTIAVAPSVLVIPEDSPSLRLENYVDSTTGNHYDVLVNAEGLFEVRNESGNTIFTIDSSGNLLNTSAFNLNDVRSGSFSPQLADLSLDGTGEGQVYGTQTGRWTLIGNRVFIDAYIKMIDIGTLSSSLTIVNLPFPARVATDTWYSCGVGRTLGFAITAGETVTGSVTGGPTNRIILSLWDAASGVSTLLATEFTDDGEIAISCSYEIEP